MNIIFLLLNQFPPKQLIELVQPVRDKCIIATGTTDGKWLEIVFNIALCRPRSFCDFLEAIKRYSDEPISANPPVDQNLKCYMHCFFRTLIEHEWSHEHFDSEALDVENWFTEEEIDFMTKMDEQCDTISLEEPENLDCEHAYTVVSCLKAANEEVKLSEYPTQLFIIIQ